jgi:hypothetical protein
MSLPNTTTFEDIVYRYHITESIASILYSPSRYGAKDLKGLQPLPFLQKQGLTPGV